MKKLYILDFAHVDDAEDCFVVPVAAESLKEAKSKYFDMVGFTPEEDYTESEYLEAYLINVIKIDLEDESWKLVVSNIPKIDEIEDYLRGGKL